MPKYFILLLSTILSFSCTRDVEAPTQTLPGKHDYIFLGHTYRWGQSDPPNVDKRIEQLDYSKYDGIWLGGDIVHTILHANTLDYLDNIFDIDHEDTHWSLGNHEVRDGNLELIKSKTNKDDFYITTKNNISILVLNTPTLSDTYIDDCNAQTAQFALINNVLDTLSISDHLVILSHYAMWGDVESGANSVGTIANSDQRWNDFLCDERTRFHEVVYPKLVNIKNQGIDVFIVAGDGGQKSKGNSYISEDGIHLIVSGINNSISIEDAERLNFNTNPDSVLIFHQDMNIGTLVYEFVQLNEL